MKLLIVLALVAAVYARPDDSHYDTKYDNFNVEELTENTRLLKAYAHCFLNKGKCTPEGSDFKKWMPDAVESSCGKCTEKQKVLVAKCIKAIQVKLPDEYKELINQFDPENKHASDLQKFLDEHGQ